MAGLAVDLRARGARRILSKAQTNLLVRLRVRARVSEVECGHGRIRLPTPLTPQFFGARLIACGKSFFLSLHFLSLRYQTAGELGADLRRFVNRHAIQARRVGIAGRAAKWVRRHPGLTAG